MTDYDDKDLAIIAVLIIAIVGLTGMAFNPAIDAVALARDCILVLGSVATGKALAK